MRRLKRSHFQLQAQPLEERRLLAADLMLPSMEHGFPGLEAILSQHVENYPRPGEMVFLGTGPHPDELTTDIPHNDQAADTTNAENLRPGGSSGLNLTGAGYTVGIWEASSGLVRSTHQEFGNRVTIMEGGSGSTTNHATHVAGTIGASGVDIEAQGMAPQVNIRSWTSGGDNDEIPDNAALIHVSNHSYGKVTGWRPYSASGAPGGPFTTPTGDVDVWLADYSLSAVEDDSFGKYDSNTAGLDAGLANSPNVLSVWSAGNDRNDFFENQSGNNTYVTYFSADPGGIGWSGGGWYLVNNSGSTVAPGGDGNGGTGYDSLSSDQVAKNSLVVGSIRDVTADPYNNSNISLNSFSSFGPTDDGRIKPDVVGNGNSLYSTSGSSNAGYYNSSGTSMSSPNVAGSSILLIEHFHNRFGFEPTASTTKSLLIHTAYDAGNAGPDYAHGWGLVDVLAGANLVSEATSADPSTHVFELSYTGSEISHSFDSVSGEPLKVTIAWTDPAGAPIEGLDNPTSNLVNDLDLWVVGPDGTSFPWTLNPSIPASPAVRTTANHVDNVEQVLIDTPAPGTYTVHVGATGDVFDQDFSMIISGATTSPVFADCDLDADNDCDLDDIDRLYDEIRSEANGTGGDVAADLDGSGLVDNNDIDDWLALASTSNGLVYLPGDTDLNGDVSGSDFTALASQFGNLGEDPSLAAAYWRHGNFDGISPTDDFEVGGSDFTILAINFGHESLGEIQASHRELTEAKTFLFAADEDDEIETDRNGHSGCFETNMIFGPTM